MLKNLSWTAGMKQKLSDVGVTEVLHMDNLDGGQTAQTTWTTQIETSITTGKAPVSKCMRWMAYFDLSVIANNLHAAAGPLNIYIFQDYLGSKFPH
jgi:hypothetical protein